MRTTMDNSEKLARMVLDDPSDVLPLANWKAYLLKSEHGVLKPLLANAITFFGGAPEFAGLIKFNEFASRIMLLGAPPWEHSSKHWEPRPWSDVDDIRAAGWLQRHGVAVNANTAGQAITAVAERQKFHPVVDYLDRCKWDGQPRLSSWLSEYLSVPSTPYHDQVGRCALIAAVARVRRPGSKVDTMPILEGAQGLGKSTLLGPAVEAIIDGRVRTVFAGAIAPSRPRLQHVNDPADDAGRRPAPVPSAPSADEAQYAPLAYHSAKTNLRAFAHPRIKSSRQGNHAALIRYRA